MRKHLWAWVACGLLLLAGGCEKYASLDDFAQLEKRVAALENLCNQMNTNIASLQTLISALQNNDYITSVSPVTQDGKEVGYTISFAKSAAITIYHGKDGSNGLNGSNGKDGYTPVIGVRKDSDGIYYWTLDGSWMLDTAGNKIKAEGTDGKNGADGKDGKDGKDGVDGKDGKDGKDGAAGTPGSNGQNGAAGTPGSNGQNGAAGADGKDGITPQLRITDGYWEVSYDNGTSWKRLGKATGENGTNGTPGTDGSDGDTLFEDITIGEESVTFKLSSGEEFSLPRTSTLDILFETTNLALAPGSTLKVPFSLIGNTDQMMIEALSSSDLKVMVYHSGTKGTLQIKMVDGVESLDEYSKVVVILSDGTRTILRTLTFEEMLVKVEEPEGAGEPLIEIAGEGEEFVLEFYSNTDDYEVVIGEEDKNWIEVIATKAMTLRNVTLKIKQNDKGHEREANVQIKIKDKDHHLDFKVKQNEKGYVPFKDANFKAYCVENFDTDGDGKISFEEAEAITRIEVNTENIKSLKGIEHMPNLIILYCSPDWTHARFSSETRKWILSSSYGGEEVIGLLTSLDLSNNPKLETLNCVGNQLTQIDIHNNKQLTTFLCYFNSLTNLDVSNNTNLSYISCEGNQLAKLDVSNLTSLRSFNCGYNQLTSLDVSNNNNLEYLTCTDNLLTSLDLGNRTKLVYLNCPRNQLTSLDVSNNLYLENVDCKNNLLTSLDLSNNTELVSLDFRSNQLTNINLSNNTELASLYFQGNLLTSIDLSNNTKLKYLWCGDNLLTSLDLSNNLYLKEVNCFSCPNLTEIWLKTNQQITTIIYDPNIATIKYKD